MKIPIILLKQKNKVKNIMTYFVQHIKILEEVEEVGNEINKDEIDEGLLLGELWDVIQSAFTMIFFITTDKKRIKKSYKEHIKKLELRNKKSKITIDGYLEL